MSGLLKLRLTILGTTTLVIAISTLFMAVLLSLAGALNIASLIFMVLLFNLGQWLIAPYLIDALYRAEEIPEGRHWLSEAVKRLSARSGLKPPKLMLANIPIPNAFAYGSPLSGPKIAVTKGLLNALEREEVEAVIGHELGHLKHRDVQFMMFLSVLPAVFYYLGYSMMYSSWYGGYSDRERGSSPAILIGLASIAVYWILNLLVLGLSRLREYYADAHSVSIVEDGRRKLSEALAKIVAFTGRGAAGRMGGAYGSFKCLFITDPDRAAEDLREVHGIGGLRDEQLVREVMSRGVTILDRIMELFSTHPNIVKRLRAIQSL
ncbi:MAG: zinc metalloprotease HtpX [Candidatus Bathyarchaeia archaeon]